MKPKQQGYSRLDSSQTGYDRETSSRVTFHESMRGNPVPGHIQICWSSASSLKDKFGIEELLVWPWAKGEARGKGILPLYSTIPQAAIVDPEFHEWLALVDTLLERCKRECNQALHHLNLRLT